MDAAFAYRTHHAFELLGPIVCPPRGPRNARLRVDVVDTGIAEDARTLIVVLPWAIEGVIFVPDERFPSSLVIGGRRHRVLHHELPELGSLRTVELVPDVTPLPSPRHARKIACLLAPLFRDAVAQARHERVAA
jgi:hypothetical protein